MWLSRPGGAGYNFTGVFVSRYKTTYFIPQSSVSVKVSFEARKVNYIAHLDEFLHLQLYTFRLI